MAKENKVKKENVTEETEQAEQTVYSYHTFMFPFLFEMNKTTRKKFEKCCHPGWFADIWDPNKMNESVWYNQYHYFNQAAHNVLYMTEDTEKAVVRNLRFDLLSLTEQTPKADPEREKDRPKTAKNPIKYVICKGEKTYSVDVNAIRMKLYNTGVGVLIFELENRRYPTEKEVIEINDFGRRIYAPYYAYYNDRLNCSICADRIYFEIDGKGVEQEKSTLLPDVLMESADTTVLAEPILRLLSNDEYRVTTKENCGKDEICIKPVIDDRMFVACYYKNADFVDAMREWDGEHYRYITHAMEKAPFDNKDDQNAAHRLYTMMYVDGDGICCHGRNILENLLSDDHIYTRWLEYWNDYDKEFQGTITGFSEYTMICVAKKPADYLITPFLTQYVEMAILALVQRASLLCFEYMISECARGNNYRVEDIQEKYILFQSQILLKEVSSQQQGIELYDMLEKNLMIEKEQNEIKAQIEGLFTQKNFDHDRKENRILFWLSVLSIVDASAVLVEIFSDGLASICAKLGTIVGIGLIALLLYKRKK